MTPQELRTSILQLAFQGKLVPQHLEDGVAAELLQSINRIKTDKQLKKEKTSTEINEDELPFEIPESWTWVHLNQIATTSLGKTLDKVKNTGTMRPYLCSINVYWNGIDLTKVKEARFEDAEAEKYLLRKGDLLICEGGEVGRSAVWYSEAEMYYQNALHRVRFNCDIVPEFYKYLLECYKGMGIIDRYSKGVTIKHLVQNALYAMWLPLPPVAEQKRIVAKIEELLPLIDRYEQAWSKLEDFNKRFPVDMQKSILQMAIQGKLLEQRLEEGTGEELYQQIQAEKQCLIKAGTIKKEKPLPEITEDEIPFDIPENWKWVRLGSLLHKLVDGTHRTPKYTASGVPFVSVRNMSNGTLSLEDTKFISQEEHRELWNRCNPQRGDILLSKVGTTGVPAKVNTDKEFSLFVSVALLKFNNDLLDIDFLIYSILAPDFQKQCKEHTRGVGNKNWVIVDIANTIMPLPPLAEQKRIVARLEEILPLCERLK